MSLFVVLFVEHAADAVAHAWVKGCRQLSRWLYYLLSSGFSISHTLSTLEPEE